MVPLRHILHDGDTVEILTSNAQKPNKDWLEFVVSGKARSRIRHDVRTAENARSRELGRGILERELRRAGLSLARVLERNELDEVARLRARGGVEDLMSAVGYGRVAAADVVRALRPDWKAPEEPEEKPRKLRDIFRRAGAAAGGERCPHRRSGGRSGALRQVLRAASRRRRGRLRHARPRCHGAPEGLPGRLRDGRRAAHRRRLGDRHRGGEANPRAGHVARRARPSREGSPRRSLRPASTSAPRRSPPTATAPRRRATTSGSTTSEASRPS